MAYRSYILPTSLNVLDKNQMIHHPNLVQNFSLVFNHLAISQNTIQSIVFKFTDIFFNKSIFKNLIC